MKKQIEFPNKSVSCYFCHIRKGTKDGELPSANFFKHRWVEKENKFTITERTEKAKTGKHKGEMIKKYERKYHYAYVPKDEWLCNNCYMKYNNPLCYHKDKDTGKYDCLIMKEEKSQGTYECEIHDGTQEYKDTQEEKRTWKNFV